jgi:pimeloyl-ACP methyl ester carboxylesterase
MRSDTPSGAGRRRGRDPAIRALLRLGLFALAALLAVYAAACAWLYTSQASLLYYPVRAASLVDARVLPGRDARVLYSGREVPGQDALVYFGGNAEDVSRTLPDLAQAFPGHALYLLHYRGYGGSAGKPGEATLRGDALALYDLARSRHARVLLVGRSLGSGLAAQVAAARAPARLVLVTPYDSLAEVGQAHYPWLPVRWLARDHYDSAAVAPRIDAPTLLLVAGDDTIIPRASSERLRAHFARGVATWRLVPGAGHNDIGARTDYFADWANP